jgi:hypothetical protein
VACKIGSLPSGLTNSVADLLNHRRFRISYSHDNYDERRAHAAGVESVGELDGGNPHVQFDEGCRKRALATRACALIYRSPRLVSPLCGTKREFCSRCNVVTQLLHPRDSRGYQGRSPWLVSDPSQRNHHPEAQPGGKPPWSSISCFGPRCSHCYFGGVALKKRADLFWATLGEGGLVLALAAIGWATRQPLIFASLGPTAYELVEQPQVRSARVYNIVVGHLIGLGAGFLAVYLMNAWTAPNVISAGIVSTERVWATTIAATLTTFFTLILRAGQPAALATTLLVSLGAMQTRQGALAIVAGVLIITIIGEPVRRFRLKHTEIRRVGGEV